MKKLIRTFLYTCISVLFFNTVSAQDTEGWIKYKVAFKSPMPQMVSHEDYLKILTNEMGDLSNAHVMYYFTPTQYASKMVMGKNTTNINFVPNTNKVYSWENSSKTALLYDSKVSEDELYGIVVNPILDTIQGIPCKSIILKTSDTYQIVWYNEAYFPIDPEVYKNHQFGHYYDILKVTRSIPLKYEVKTNMMHFVQTIEDHQLEKVNASVFEIPKFKKLLNGFEERNKNMSPK